MAVPLLQPASHVVKSLKPKNISVYCAITKNGIIKETHRDAAFDTDSFTLFIDELRAEIEQKGMTKVAIIMDNVPFHKSTIIRTKIEEKSHMLLFLPPYSPFLNPIENSFSKIKQHVRQARPTDQRGLLALISGI